MRTHEIRMWVGTLMQAFKPRPPISRYQYEILYAQRAYTEMLGLVKASLGLDMRLRVGYANNTPAKVPMWIPAGPIVPLYGTAAFRQTLVTVYLYKPFLAE